LAEKDKQLQNKDSEISLLTNENQELKAINQEKDRQLAKHKKRLKNLGSDFDKSQRKLNEITEQNNSLVVKENPQSDLLAQIQVCKKSKDKL